MTPSKIMSELQGCVFNSKGFFINFKTIRKDATITWETSSKLTIPHEFKNKDFELLLLNDYNFSFQFFEGSVFQFYYSFEKEILSRARMAFYLNPESINDYHIEGNVTWLRIDYNTSCSEYDPCHLHISHLLPDVRIGINAVPSPKEFLLFVVHLFFPQNYPDIRQYLPSSISSTQSDILIPDLIHLSCPT